MTVSVLVPSSLTREAEDKREATRKLGYVARAATIFRVDRLIVYPDRDGEGRFDGGFVRTVLRYATTPPALRKEVWGHRDELEYAGILPPLRAMSQTGSESDDSGSSRQGIVTEVGPDNRVRVNCGLQHPISLNVPPEMVVDEGDRVTVRIYSRRPVRAKLVDEPLPGLSVEWMDLSAALGREDAGVRIAASRHGEPLTVGRLATLAGPIDRDGMTVAFGAPERGLPDILDIEESTATDVGFSDRTTTGITDGVGTHAADGIDRRPDDADTNATGDTDTGTDAATGGTNTADRQRGGNDVEPTGQIDGVDDETVAGFDCWLNTVPDQGSAVVRTEEAIFATLAPLSLRA